MTHPVLEAIALSQVYRSGGGLFQAARTVTAVSEVSFTLMAGETLGVVGESGSGKSTLARILAMQEHPFAGEIRVDGQPVDVGSARERRSRNLSVQMVYQNPFGSLNPRRTVGDTLTEPLRLNGIGNRQSRRAVVSDTLVQVGLNPDHAGRYPHMFSGGQRQRIAIARALMLGPRAIVADEAVSALDVSVQAQILNLLMDLQARTNVAYLFISHDLSVIRHLATHVLVMYFGRMVEMAPKSSLFTRPLHPYTQLLLASSHHDDAAGALPKPSRLAGPELPSPFNPPAGCAFASRCPIADGLCDAVRPPLDRIGNHLVACHKAEAASLGHGLGGAAACDADERRPWNNVP